MVTGQHQEQQLTTILSLLNPPQQDYEILADEAWRFLNTLPPEPSVVRALTTYFELFASGYAHWQQTYDYPTIHEYFYGAYLQAKNIGGNLSTQLTEMLKMMTKAMIAYTNCENALINNDPQSLLQSATQATTYGKGALTLLSQTILGSSLTNTIGSYLQMNSHLWQGLAICAQGYLDAQQGKELSDSDQRTMEHLLQMLGQESQELFSELNAHYSFVQRHSQFRSKTTSSLLIKQGELLLRATGYIGEKEVSALFKKFNKVEKPELELCELIRRNTGLPIVAIRASYLMDIFDTVLGKKYLDQIVFDFSSDEPALTFKLHMDSREITYQAEVFRINIARFGAISVEFGIPLHNISVSHMRTLESLIGPHAGRLNFVWRGAPEEVREGFDASNRIDFVEYFLHCQERLSSLLETLPEAQATKFANIRIILNNWESKLRELANFLPRRSASAGYEDQVLTEKRNEIYISLQEDFNQVYQIVQSYLNNFTATEDLVLKQLRALEREIFAEGRTFGRLMSIAQLIVNCMQRFLEQEFALVEYRPSQKRTQRIIQTQDVRYLSAFDCDTGWQSIVSCNELVIVEADGKELKPGTEAEYQLVLAHPEFKGFAIQPREARAGVDDWIFVNAPEIQNLATIRSHENDVLYVGANKAFLWFPDDPQFLVNQYIETTRIIADIRTLVLTFNNSAKKQVEELEAFLERVEKFKEDRHLRFKQSQQELLGLRSGIEIFYIHAERVLDLLRSCTISKYQDHSELLKRMLRESEADDSQISLERNIENLGRLHGYLTNLLQQKIEERNQSNQTLITSTLFILTFLSALSAIPVLYQFLDLLLGSIIEHSMLLRLMTAMLGIVIGCCIIIGLIIWQRSRNI